MQSETDLLVGRAYGVVQASTTGEAAATGSLAVIEMHAAGAVCSALPHTVSQDLHANHDGQPARSRQGDGWQVGKQAGRLRARLRRLASSRLVSSLLLLAPHLRHAPALQWLTFFSARGIPEDPSVAASA